MPDRKKVIKEYEDYVNSLFEAKGAFDDLTEEQQVLVSNKDALDDALAKYKNGKLVKVEKGPNSKTLCYYIE